MRDKDTSALREVFQCSSLAEKPFYQWDKSRHGLVKITYSGDNWWCPLHCQVHLCKKNNLTITSQELLNKRESNNLHDELNYFTWFANNCQSCWKDDLIVYHNTYCLWQGQRQGPLQYHQQLLLHRSGELFFFILLAPSGALIAIPTYYWPIPFTFSDHTGPQHWTFTFWATTAI